ncbi:MAG: signal peptide peptidase SppA [Thiomicrorhabdus sp.]|nr:signal peptide peptidase SppA [Thiomicrorhabdus sp.]
MEQSPENNNNNFERLAQAVESLVKQERWTRRFANFLKLAIAAYVIFFIYITVQKFNTIDKTSASAEGKKHVAVVNIEGPIIPGTKVSAEVINPLLEKAFRNDSSSAVIIKANSPGGSPVQSAMINDEIIRLKALYKKPVYVVVEDVCASGCYYIAVAADKIYADKGSMIGSIGVRMDTFGFTGLMEKLGIENRSMHAGDHKAFIDPFSNKNEEGRQFFQKMVLEKTHQQFIDTVRAGRGDRLQTTPEIFSGLVWLGEDAVKNGLIDELNTVGGVARDIVGVDDIKVYSPKKSFMEEIMGDITSQTSAKLALMLSSMR